VDIGISILAGIVLGIIAYGWHRISRDMPAPGTWAASLPEPREGPELPLESTPDPVPDTPYVVTPTPNPDYVECTQDYVDRMIARHGGPSRFNESHHEREMRRTLIQLFPERDLRREYCHPEIVRYTKKPLRFDFYYPCLNLAIEVDGSQHWKKHPTDQNEKDLYRRMTNDRLKDNACRELGIRILRVKMRGGRNHPLHRLHNEKRLDWLRGRIIEVAPDAFS
jgi:very-short-patch-repair endonuclease